MDECKPLPDMSNTPALLIRQCTGHSRALTAVAKARTLSSESRSRCMTTVSGGAALASSV